MLLGSRSLKGRYSGFRNLYKDAVTDTVTDTVTDIITDSVMDSVTDTVTGLYPHYRVIELTYQ